jgi:hypothetical protein
VSDGLLHGLTGMRKGTPGKHGRGRERRKRELMMYGQGVPLRNNPLEGTTRFCSKPRTRVNSMGQVEPKRILTLRGGPATLIQSGVRAASSE